MNQIKHEPWSSYARLRQSARVQPLALKAMEREIDGKFYRWEITETSSGARCSVFVADERVWRAMKLSEFPAVVAGSQTLLEAYRTGVKKSVDVLVDGEVPVNECKHHWETDGSRHFRCGRCGWMIPKSEYDQMAAWRDVKAKITDGRRRLEQSTRRELLDVIDMLFAIGIIKPDAIPTKREQLPEGHGGDVLFKQIERHRELLLKFVERKKQ